MSTDAVAHEGDPVPRYLAALVDDAAIFPPGNAPPAEAVAAHRAHRAAPYASLVGPFVVSDTRLPELGGLVSPAGELEIALVVTGGAGAIGPAVTWTGRSAVRLRALEVALRETGTGDVAGSARRVTTMVDQLVAVGDLDEDVPVYVEPPRLYGEEPPASWLAALDELAATGHRLKFRTGGADADAFPGAAELAAGIAAALDRELAFKCTAGLHHALRHRDEQTGFDHHGFLNVLLATRSGLDGASTAEVAAVLERTDPAEVTGALGDAGPDALASARRWFTGFGSCSIADPLADLTGLGLMEER